MFVANGDRDPMMFPRYSYLLAGLIPRARLMIYPDAAQGFFFQHHAEFAADVDASWPAHDRDEGGRHSIAMLDPTPDAAGLERWRQHGFTQPTSAKAACLYT